MSSNIHACARTSQRKRTRQIHDSIRDGNIVKFTYLIRNIQVGKIDILDDDGLTPLMIACSTIYKTRRVERVILESILSLKPRTNMVDSRGRTALIHACIINNFYSVEQILMGLILDIDVNIQDDDGMTAIMYAVQNDNPAIVKLLLEFYLRYKLTLSLRNKDGDTVTDIAFKRGYSEVIEELIDAGCCKMYYNQNDQHRPLSDPSNKLDHTKLDFVRSKTIDGIRIRKKRFPRKIRPVAPCTTAESTTSTKQNEVLHQIFDLYGQQLSSAYKSGAKFREMKKPIPEKDSDSDNDFSLPTRFTHLSQRELRKSHAGMESHFKNLHLSQHGKPTRQRKTGMTSLAVSRPALRKISAPCFSNNNHHNTMLSFRVPKQRAITPARILEFQ